MNYVIQLGCCYAEGDLWHPPSNMEKMSRGVPLTDEVMLCSLLYLNNRF